MIKHLPGPFPTRSRAVIHEGRVHAVSFVTDKKPDMYLQTKSALAHIDATLRDAGTDKSHFRVCAGFRTPGWDAIHALRRPASEKRQGRKSREVGHWRCRGCYGDLAAGFGLMRLDRIGCRDRFSAKPV
jgi:hypothetical protein